jgi:hypothetical protein
MAMGIAARTPPAVSTWRFEYRGHIGCNDGTLEPTFNSSLLGAMDSLAPGGRHCTESLYQKAQKRFGFSLGSSSDESLGLALGILQLGTTIGVVCWLRLSMKQHG